MDHKFHENQVTASFLLAKNAKKKSQQLLPKQKINKQNPKPNKKQQQNIEEQKQNITNQPKMK